MSIIIISMWLVYFYYKQRAETRKNMSNQNMFVLYFAIVPNWFRQDIIFYLYFTCKTSVNYKYRERISPLWHFILTVSWKHRYFRPTPMSEKLNINLKQLFYVSVFDHLSLGIKLLLQFVVEITSQKWHGIVFS